MPGRWRTWIFGGSRCAILSWAAGTPAGRAAQFPAWLPLIGAGRSLPARWQGAGVLVDCGGTRAKHGIAFDERYIQLAFVVSPGSGHQEIANIDERDEIEDLVLAIQDDELIAGATRQAKDS